jgi:hypothetical protein
MQGTCTMDEKLDKNGWNLIVCNGAIISLQQITSSQKRARLLYALQ